MPSTLSLLLALAPLVRAAPHFEYHAIGIRGVNNVTKSEPSHAGTGTMAMPTVTNIFDTSAYCKAQKSKFYATYQQTHLLTTTVTDYKGFDDTGDQTGSVVSQTYSTRTVTYTENSVDAYASGGAKPPCCSTCQITAGTIQFYWWPDLASSTATETVTASDALVTEVAPNGFVFTSPSVYMAFSSLYAQNYCGTVGDVWANTTIGFHPDEMTTLNAYRTTFTSYRVTTEDGTVESELITASGYQPPPSKLKYSDLAQNCSSRAGYVYFPDDPQNDVMGVFEQDPCHPILQLPPSLVSSQPAWVENHCRPDPSLGAYDPPQALTAATAAAMPTLSAPAQPGSTGTASSAPVTTTFTAQPDTTPTSSAAASSAASSSSPATVSSSAQAVETTAITGSSSSSSTTAEAPAPVVASSQSSLDTPSASSNDISFNSPNVQHSASELATPTQASSPVAVTTEEEQTPSSANTPAPSIILAGHTYTADSSSNFIVYGQTYAANVDTVTVDNTPAAVIPATSIAAATAATSSSSADIGHYIMSAIGQNQTASSTTGSPSTTSETVEVQTGGAVTIRSGATLMLCLMMTVLTMI